MSRCMKVLLSAWSWHGQPVYTTTLYKPTKCKNLRERRCGTVSAVGGYKELTVSGGCQNWVTVPDSTQRHSTAESQPKGKSRRARRKWSEKDFNAENTEECRETQ